MTGDEPRADFFGVFGAGYVRLCASRIARAAGKKKAPRRAVRAGAGAGAGPGAGAGAGAGAVEAIARARGARATVCWRWAPAGARAGANWRHLSLSGASCGGACEQPFGRRRRSTPRGTRPFEAPSALMARALAGRGDGDDVRSASMVQRARAHGTRTHHVRPGALHPAGPRPASMAIPDPTLPTQNECCCPLQYRTPNFGACLACWEKKRENTSLRHQVGVGRRRRAL